jgi:hypothetical protein
MFLRKAEKPSHTEWQHYHLKEDYQIGYKTDLNFVKRSVHELVRIISETEKEEDPTLLVDFFSLPKGLVEEEPQDVSEPDEGDDDGHETVPPKPDIPLSPRSYRILEIDGGFSILPGKGDNPPDKLKINVAYDTRRGNPLKKYNKVDFEIDEEPICFKPDAEGVEVLEVNRNAVVIKILDNDFKFYVTGFDKRRQLYIKTYPIKEVKNGRS